MMTPTITIIGRINVGKSSLFNRLIEEKKAITSRIPGTTRDRNYGKVYWRGKFFQIIDSGGVDIETLKNSIRALSQKKPFKSQDSIEKEVILQTQKAMREADLLLFVVDTQTGSLPEDRDLAVLLKKMAKPVLLVANKADNPRLKMLSAELYNLGFGKPFAVSALNGSGTGDLLDEIFEILKNLGKEIPDSIDEAKPTPVAIIGKTNVGKSSLLNALVGEKRVIVSEIPNTTREPQDIIFLYEGILFQFIDTAGLRKKTKIHGFINTQASKRSLEMIKKSEIIIFVLEANEPVLQQDQALARLIEQYARAAIIVANKWDLIDDQNDKRQIKIKNYIYGEIPHMAWAPVVFTVAASGQNIKKILHLMKEVSEKKNLTIDQESLDLFTKKLINTRMPRGGSVATERPKIKKIIQDEKNKQGFIVLLGKKQSLHEAYTRFIKKMLYQNFNLIGLNIKISVHAPRK